MSTGYGGPFGMPQASVLNADNSPFAMFTMDSQDMAMNMGMSVVAPQSASTARSSGRGAASSRSNNSGGSNHASNESGLAPLPDLPDK
jgi:hypothetical protein